jgi:exodeoxyribonuclease V alpha subunit
MTTLADPLPFVRRLFPETGPELLRLYEQAADASGLMATDFYTIRDLLELSGYESREPLHALLLAMLLARDAGSLCVEVSEPGLMRQLGDLAGEDVCRAWARRILAGLSEDGFPDLVGRCVADNKPVVLQRLGERLLCYFHKDLKNEAVFRDLLGQRLASGQTEPAGNLRAILQEVLVEQPLRFDGRPAQLNHDQRLALGLALLRRFAIISGGPGTGKTSIVFTLLRCLARRGIPPERMALAAPTGRAAQRLTEALHSGLNSLKPAPETGPDASLKGLTARTLHQLLGYQPSRATFRHHAENQLVVDAIIVDEVSMVGVELMAQLFQATAPTTRLILLGDKDQLPSVEAGAILAALVPADGLPRYSDEMLGRLSEILPDVPVPAPAGLHPLRNILVVLEENYRSEKAILEVAQAVNRQDAQVADRIPRVVLSKADPRVAPRDPAFPTDASFGDLESHGGCWLLEPVRGGTAEWRRVLTQWAEHHFLTSPSGEESYSDLIAGCEAPGADEVSAEQGSRLDSLFALLGQGRILTLVREGPWGCSGINQFLEQLLRPRLDPASPGRLFAGAPVLIGRNDYGRQLFNGDVGITLRSGAAYRVVFQRLGGYVSWPADSLPVHDLAFALTVHKSQGSEYGHVLLVLPPEGGRRLLTKELIYTGITRAKHSVVICADKETLRFSIGRKVEREAGMIGYA